jgi:diketogulonate reductase-like aldo/keto reductase
LATLEDLGTNGGSAQERCVPKLSYALNPVFTYSEPRRAGKVKSIGVSNFSELKLDEILPTAEVIPAVNQLEIHLYNPQLKLVEYLKSKGIVPQAYSPLGSTGSPLLEDETALKIAEKHNVHPVDILLGYLRTRSPCHSDYMHSP